MAKNKAQVYIDNGADSFKGLICPIEIHQFYCIFNYHFHTKQRVAKVEGDNFFGDILGSIPCSQ